jgi:hypothetical protein
MTQWILIVVMSSSASIGINFWRQPAGMTAVFADKAACDSAAEVVRKMVNTREARLESPAAAVVCVPSASEPAK